MKTLGILGGMGPEATHFFYKKIVEGTPASCDQEHIPTLIFSNSQIPDRSAKIESQEFTEIHSAMINSAKILQAGGAEVLMIPCNTAHYFIDVIQDNISIPVLNMIEETAAHIHESQQAQKVGILGTNATVKTGLYQKALNKYDIDVIVPSAEDQQIVMESILQVKAGNSSAEVTDTLLPVKARMRELGVQRFVLGCTEIPLLFQRRGSEDLIDPMDILAKVAIEFALEN